MASVKEIIHAHTYSGRYEQYRATHDYLLDQSQGEARYLLEQRLDADAKKHAQRKVAMEILGVAVVATGAVVLGRSLKNGDLIGDVRNVENLIREMPTKVSFAYRKFIRTTGELFMGGMLSRAQEDGLDVLDSLTPAAARIAYGVGGAVVSGASDTMAEKTVRASSGLREGIAFFKGMLGLTKNT